MEPGIHTETLQIPGKTCIVCFSTSDIKDCANCGKVHYCSTDHQRSHWKVHRKDCIPFKEVWNEEFGHYLLASRQIDAGEVICKDVALIASPYYTSTNDNEFWAICLGCCRILERNISECEKVCPQCCWPLCSSNCPKAKHHTGFECKVLKKAGLKAIDAVRYIYGPRCLMPNYTLYKCILILRFLLLEKFDKDKWKKLMTFESHSETRNGVADQVYLSQFYAVFIREYCQLPFSHDLIHQIVGIVEINLVGRAGDIHGRYDILGETAIFRGCIFETSSRLLHSCLPNVMIFNPTSAKPRLFAIKTIKAGETLNECYSYDKLFWQTTMARRFHLHRQFYFWCKCERCADPTELGTFGSAVKCKRKINSRLCEGYFLPVNPLDEKSSWKCNGQDCNTTKQITTLNNFVLKKVDGELAAAKSVVELLQVLRRTATIKLHDNHMLLMRVRLATINPLANVAGYSRETAAHKECRDTLLPLTTKSLELADKLQLGCSFFRGTLLYNHVQALENQLSGLKYEGREGEEIFNEYLEEFSRRGRDALDILANYTEDYYGKSAYEWLANNLDELTVEYRKIQDAAKLVQAAKDVYETMLIPEIPSSSICSSHGPSKGKEKTD